MRLSRPRFTVLGMMIGIALVALDLASAAATRRALPERGRGPLPVSLGNGRGLWHADFDGGVTLFRGNAESGYRDPLLIRPPRPTFPRIISPAVAGAAITLLALVVASGRPRSRIIQAATLVVLIPVAAVALWGWWVLYGGGVPVDRLSLDMPRDEVLRILGPPHPAGSTSSTWLIAPHGSLRYVTLEFDERNRLRSIDPGSHERGGHPARIFRSD